MHIPLRKPFDFASLANALDGISATIATAAWGSAASLGQVAELERRVAQLKSIDFSTTDPSSVEMQARKAAELTTDLVCKLRLPESLLDPLRDSHLVEIQYGGLGTMVDTFKPAPLKNILMLRSAERLKARKFPNAYHCHHRALKPMPTAPQRVQWSAPQSTDPRYRGPGDFVATVSLQSLPTIPVHECLHRLLFSRAADRQANWAADPLLEPGRLKWPAEDADPMIVALLKKTRALPEEFSGEQLAAGTFGVASARLLFAIMEDLVDVADARGNVDLARYFTDYHREPLPARHPMTEAIARALMSPVDSPDDPIVDSLDPIAIGDRAFKRALPLCEGYKELGQLIPALEQRFPSCIATYLNEHFRWAPVLPALELASKHVASDRFKDCILLCAQHLLPSQIPMFDKFLEHGAAPHDIVIAGVPYSTNPLVTEMLQARGIQVLEKDEVATSLLGTYDDARRAEMKDAVDSAAYAARLMGKKLIVLDDGGIICSMLHEHHRDVLPQTRVVEQTMRGLTEAARYEIGCPIIDVPTSDGKREEGKFIAEDLMRGLAEVMPEAGINQMEGVGITIVGYGTTGRHLANLCRLAKMDVHVVELRDDRRDEAEAAGFKTYRRVNRAAQHCRIGVGCTGRKSFPREVIRDLPDGFLLASGSSAEVEIDCEFLIHHGVQRHRVPLQAYWLAGKRILLANGGRPVNFDNARDIDADKIQVTRTWMFRAACQAAQLPNDAPAKVIPLTTRGQREILDYLHNKVWAGMQPKITVPEPRERDETLWKEVEDAYANGQDLFKLLEQNDGDTMFWLGPVLEAAKVALFPARMQDSVTDRMARRRGMQRTENVPTVFADPNGQLMMATTNDNLVPPLFQLPLHDVIPVRIERLTDINRKKGKATETDYLLWTDDAEGNRTAHRIRLHYEIAYDNMGMMPIRPGAQGTSVPNLTAKLLDSYPDASVITTYNAPESEQSVNKGTVIQSGDKFIDIDPSGCVTEIIAHDWIGPLRINRTTGEVELVHLAAVNYDVHHKVELLPMDLRSVTLPAGMTQVEDAYTAIHSHNDADRWPFLSTDKFPRSSSLLICVNREGHRFAVAINWHRSGDQPVVSEPVPIPDGSWVRHAEPHGSHDPNAQADVHWNVHTHVPGTIDERGEWPVTVVKSSVPHY